MPIWVCSLQSTTPITMSREVTRIIRQEHTDISAVLYVFKEALQRLATNGNVDGELLRGLLDYVATYPWRWHHPKEEFLIEALRSLGDPADTPLLDRLSSDHRDEEQRVAALGTLFTPLISGDPDAAGPFVAAGERFIADEWAHMKAEEQHLLPRLESALDDAVWMRLAIRLDEFDHPAIGLRPADDARRLFARILELALRTSQSDAKFVNPDPLPRKDR